MSRHRKFCIVFHNVETSCKPRIEAAFADSDRLLVAVEPYPAGNGHHAHVFVSYPNAHRFKSMLERCKALARSDRFVSPRPEGTEGDWGRVQVDVMHGSWDQATAYLTAPSKAKPLDPSIINADKRLEAIIRNHRAARELLIKDIYYPEFGGYRKPLFLYMDQYDTEPYSVPQPYQTAFFHYYYIDLLYKE